MYKENHDIINGAEPFYYKGNNIGILVSHGFVGTPQSMEFLGESLANYGFTVYGIRLSGHGTHYRDLENVNYHNWMDDFERGYQLLKNNCKHIFVVGQSMGGTLTLDLASKFDDLKGIMLINPAMFIPSFNKFMKCDEATLLEEGSPDIKANNVKEITYDKTPLRAIQQLLKLLDVVRNKLSNVSCPTLSFQSIEDHVVPAENTDFILQKINAKVKRKIVLKDSYHVASMDNEKELIVNECVHFIKDLMKMNKKSESA